MYVSGLNTLPCVHGFLLFAFSSRVYFNLQFSQNIILILEIHPHESALEPHKKAIAISITMWILIRTILRKSEYLPVKDMMLMHLSIG